MNDIECGCIVDNHAAVPACGHQLCAIMRELAVPYFVRVLTQFDGRLQGEVGSVTHVIRV